MTVTLRPMLAAKVALRRARLRRELSQAQLGARLGITQQAVAKLEDLDQNTTLESLRKAADALNAVVSVNIELRD